MTRWLVALLLSGLAAACAAEDAIRPLGDVRCDALMAAGVVTATNPVPCERLRSVRFEHATMAEGRTAEGEFVVLDLVAERTLALVERLRQRSFPIASARAIEAFGGDDEVSMRANNSSAFNGRAVTGGGRWSMHAYGVAFDLNPVENPYIGLEEDGSAQVLPPQSARYAVNRLETRVGKAPRPGMVEPVVLEFARHGFYRWGGDWNNPVDYQHFEVGSRRFVELLVGMDPALAAGELDTVATQFAACIGSSERSLGPERQRCAAAAIEWMDARAAVLAP